VAVRDTADNARICVPEVGVSYQVPSLSGYWVLPFSRCKKLRLLSMQLPEHPELRLSNNLFWRVG
jgi:hypothetical protein